MPNQNKLQRHQTGLPPSTTMQPPGLQFSKGLANKGELSPAFHELNQRRGAGQPLYNFYTFTVTVGTTPLIILGPGVRVSLQIQNLGSADVYIGVGADPSTSGFGSYKLVPDAVKAYTDGIVPSNEIRAISGTAGQLVSIELGVAA